MLTLYLAAISTIGPEEMSKLCSTLGLEAKCQAETEISD